MKTGGAVFVTILRKSVYGVTFLPANDLQRLCLSPLSPAFAEVGSENGTAL
jgi:hypothetical protein